MFSWFKLRRGKKDLRESRDVDRRASAARTLGKLGGRGCVEALIAALADAAPTVRRAACEALTAAAPSERNWNHLYEICSACQTEKDGAVRTALMDLLVEWRPESAKHLVSQLEGPVSNWVFEVLKQIGADALDELLRKLEVNNVAVRESAVSILAAIPDDRVVRGLATALQSKNFIIRDEAAKALGLIGDMRVVEPLFKALGPEVIAFDRICSALAQVRDPRAADRLLKALGHPRSDVRAAAGLALSGLKDKRAIDPLIRALQSESRFERADAAAALGAFPDARVVKALTEVLTDPDGRVRKAAVNALDSIGWQPTTDAQKAVRAVVRHQWQEAQSLGDAAVAPLVAAILDEFPERTQRESAAVVLSNLGQPGLRALANLSVNEEFRSSAARTTALEALVDSGTDTAFETLLLLFDNEHLDVREDAYRAAGKLRDVRAVEPLTRFLLTMPVIVTLADHSGLWSQGTAQAIVETLASLVELWRSELSATELSAIRSLPDYFVFECRSLVDYDRDSDTFGWDGKTTHTETVACTGVKKVALSAAESEGKPKG